MTRSYFDLRQLSSFKERYQYLRLRGVVGEQTFGWDRWINQGLYHSAEWRHIRGYVLTRDNGCDMGVEGYEIHERPIVHHMNPMTVDQIRDGDSDILDPEFLITVSHLTHNAIHYGDERLLPREPVVRRPGDTKLW